MFLVVKEIYSNFKSPYLSCSFLSFINCAGLSKSKKHDLNYILTAQDHGLELTTFIENIK